MFSFFLLKKRSLGEFTCQNILEPPSYFPHNSDHPLPGHTLAPTVVAEEDVFEVGSLKEGKEGHLGTCKAGFSISSLYCSALHIIKAK